MTVSRLLSAALILNGLALSHAFTPVVVSKTATTSAVSSETSLHAFAPPTLIIGPMIRRMREEQEKKKMPMASADESKNEAPGLRVGANAWKWPPVWPYDANFFKRKSEMNARNAAAPMSLLTGQMPTASGENATDSNVFNSMKFWEERSNITTDLDERVVMKIKNHYSFYLRDGMSILELGAAENSYLPDDLKLGRHVGIGAVKSQMEQNPSITEFYVIDLNDVVEDIGVKSVEFSNLSDESFDAVIMANTIDFLTSPREVFKSAWMALKPGGIMIVPFLSKDAYTDKFDEAQTKQWRDMTDDQHMWICGSFFQFSAGQGWEGLKGFDISPDEAKKEEEGVMSKIIKTKAEGPCSVFVVQARKNFQAEDIDEDDVEGFISSQLWMLPTLEDRDKKLVTPRLARAYNALDSEEDKEKMIQHFDSLPKIYASLIKMDQFAFTFSMQAQLAADLMGDPDFTGSDDQIKNLKMGLGLRKPSPNFWAPVGKLTSAMTPEDKVNLLAHIVPRFGSGNTEQEEALDAFVSGLEPTFSVIRSKSPSMKESDVQLLGSELLASEILKPGRSTREDFAAWLGALTEDDMKAILSKRKSFKEEASAELKQYKEDREAEQKRIEERRAKIQEQVMDARDVRTVIFNPRTGKVEEIEKKGGFKLPF